MKLTDCLNDIFDFVKDYSDFGCHRSGCDAQIATEKWLFEILNDHSDYLSSFTYTYPHFQFESRVMIDGRLIASLPVYYESTEKFCGAENILSEPIKITENDDEVHATIKDITSRAKTDGYQAVVLSTTGIVNTLYALNVSPVLKNNIPVILVPGVESDALLKGNIQLEYFASVHQAYGQNIVARFGAQSSRAPVVITTPISGWFSCAGERGAGLALAIALAIQLGKTGAVELILTSGHELGYLGGFEYANSIESSPATVIHVGSCVGADKANQNVWYNDCGLDFSGLIPLLNRFGISNTFVTAPHSPEHWVGEAQCWAKFGCPMISIAGTSPFFHTPDDQWQVAVTNKSLQDMVSVLMQIGALVLSTNSSS